MFAVFAAIAMALGWGALPVAANENTIEVTTTEPGIAPDGLCSLAEAIENANAANQLHADCAPGTGSDTIVLAAGQTYSYTVPNNPILGGNALPAILADILIAGNGATLVRDDNPTTRQPRRFVSSMSRFRARWVWPISP